MFVPNCGHGIMTNDDVFIFLLTAPGLGQGQGHGQGLILPLTTGRKNIKEAIRTVAISGDTIVAFGGHSTSEAEAAATFNEDATSVGAGDIIIRTSDPIGRITSNTHKKSSNTSSRTSKTIPKVDLRISRAVREAPLVIPLSTLIVPLRHYPGTQGILRPPHTTLPPNVGKTGCRITNMLLMRRTKPWLPRWSRRKEVVMATQKKTLVVAKERGTGRAAQTAAAVKTKPAL